MAAAETGAESGRRAAEPPAPFELALPLEIVCEVLRRADVKTAAAALADEVLGELLWPHALYVAPVEWADELAVHAAVCNRPAELAAVLARYPHVRPRLCVRAVAAGGAPALKLAQAAGAPWRAWSIPVSEWALSDDVVTAAAVAGHVDALEHLRALGCSWNGHTLVAAAGAGRFDAVRWLRGRGCGWGPWGAALAAAIEGDGSMELIRWMSDEGCPWGRAPLAAARAGRADALRLGLAAGSAKRYPKHDEQLCAAAARGGHLGLLQELRAAGYAWREVVTTAAAQSGSLETLVWAVDNGCRITDKAFAGAARGGHVHVLDWLLARGIPSAPHLPAMWVSSCAIRSCNVAVLDWLESSGLYIPADVPNSSFYRVLGLEVSEPAGAEQRVLYSLNWLMARCAPRNCGQLRDIAIRAGGNGHLQVIKRISLAWETLDNPYNNFGLIRGRTHAAAVTRGHVRAAEWMEAHGFRSASRAFVAAVAAGDLEQLVRLKSQEPSKMPTGKQWRALAFEEAAKAGRLDVLQWLIDEDVHAGDFAIVAHAGCAAAVAGQVPAMEFLARAGGEFTWRRLAMAMARCVRANEVEAITAVLKLNREVDGERCRASPGGSPPVPLLWTTRIRACALQEPTREVLELLHDGGADWGDEAASMAAGEGHLETLRWLRARGCPWGRSVIEAAEIFGHSHVVEWARANGCPE